MIPRNNDNPYVPWLGPWPGGVAGETVLLVDPYPEIAKPPGEGNRDGTGAFTKADRIFLESSASSPSAATKDGNKTETKQRLSIIEHQDHHDDHHHHYHHHYCSKSWTILLVRW